jgi:tetratricopeptide (TPR) repeat protein
MSATSKTRSRRTRSTPGRANTPTARATSSRLILLLFLGVLLVGVAWTVRSSPWAQENALRGKGTPELEAIVQQQPENAFARYYLGKNYYLERRFTEARDNYAEAARLNPQWARAQLGLGLSRYELGEVAEARDAFKQTLKLDERSAWAEYMLGKIAWSRGDANAALAHVRRATELDPRSDQAWYGLGVCYVEQRRYNDAIEAFRKAVARHDTSAQNHTALGELLVYRGKTDEGHAHYERALQLNPNYGPTCALLGEFLLENVPGPDSLSRAEELLQRATKLKAPRPAEVYSNLGQLYVQKTEYTKAVEALQESVRINPLDERALYALSNAYRRMGNTKMASITEARFKKMSKQHVLLQSLEARVFHNPNDPVSRLRLARLCRDMGLAEQAAHHYEEYVRQRPQAVEVAREFEEFITKHAPTEPASPNQDFVLRLPQK